jgi:hypothetical protein
MYLLAVRYVATYSRALARVISASDSTTTATSGGEQRANGNP